VRFSDVLGRCERLELSQIDAAERLGISERTFRRWRDRHRETGIPGLSDRRLAPSLRRASVTEIERMLWLYRDICRGFTVKHFHQQMVKQHNYVLGYTVTKLHLHREGLVVAAKKRSAHRKKRPRRPMVGMMLHQDASTHVWLPHLLFHLLRRRNLGQLRPATAASMIWWSPWRMPPARCIRPFWWMRKARLEFSGAALGDCGAWPVLLAVHRSGQSLLLHA
jgi:transposase